MTASSNWPYPRWIAHRGAGRLAPENTLAAFKVGARHGFRMFECDVQLSADGVPFLLHDASLERTTNGRGLAATLDWPALSRVDAGGWHSAAFVGEPLLTLQAIAHYCIARGYLLNIEIKPSARTQANAGTVIANAVAAWWPPSAVPPLLTSFDTAALASARQAQPQLPRGLLQAEHDQKWLQTPFDLGCMAVVGNHRLWTAHKIALAQDAGLKALAYTVNDLASAQRLGDWGIDGLITDRVDQFGAHG